MKKIKRMVCKYKDQCKQDCGHKHEHDHNTGCLNMCTGVLGAELCCVPVKKKRKPV